MSKSYDEQMAELQKKVADLKKKKKKSFHNLEEQELRECVIQQRVWLSQQR